MTLPEHAACSLMLAQIGVRQQFGSRGVLLVTLAGIAPDLDAAAKLFGDEYFWNLHHALGHSLLSITVIAGVWAAIGRLFFDLKPTLKLLGWCFIAALVHCLTDSLYWWGVEPFWPMSRFELCFKLLEYLDLIVLSIWFIGVGRLCSVRGALAGASDREGGWLRKTSDSQRVAWTTLSCFAAYVAVRAVLPPPKGFFHLLTGGWIYSAPQGTPVLDWW